MAGNPLRGSGYLLRGIKMLAEPGLRPFIIVPLLINCLLFSLAIYLLSRYFSDWIASWLAVIPDWLGFVDWLLWPLFALLILVGVYFSFALFANFIAAPFNGLLSARVEQRQRGIHITDDGWKGLLTSIPGALLRETSKWLYYLPRLVILLLLSLVPLIGPLLWFLFGAWMMAIQFCDYPMDNNRITFARMRQLLKQQRLSALGFGGLVSLAMLVPLLNLLIMPAAVIGATLFWVEEYSDNQAPAAQQGRDPQLNP